MACQNRKFAAFVRIPLLAAAAFLAWAKLPGFAQDASFTGVVLSTLPDRQIVFAQTEEGDGALVRLPEDQRPESGERFNFIGTAANEGQASLIASKAISLGAIDPVPAAIPVPGGGLVEGLTPYQWREITGTVSAAERSASSWRFEVNLAGRWVTVVTRRRGRAVTPHVVDALIKFTGVTLPSELVELEAGDTVLWVDDWDRIVIERKPPRNPFGAPVNTIREMLTKEPGEEPGGLLRLRCRVGGTVDRPVLMDANGSIAVDAEDNAVLPEGGSLVDAVGYLDIGGVAPVLRRARFRRLGLPASEKPLAPDADLAGIPWDALVREIDSLSSLAKLPREEAARGFPVRLEVVVSLVRESESLVFALSGNKGLRIKGVKDVEGLVAGDRFLARGFTDASFRIPTMVSVSMEKLGHVGLPNPIQASATGLAAGLYEGAWVEMEGVVRTVREHEQGSQLKLSYAGKEFFALPPGSTDSGVQWVGTRVKVKGVAMGKFDKLGSPLGAWIFLNDMQDLEVLKPAATRPFEKPVTTIADLRTISGRARMTRRNRLVGTVTLAWSDRIFLRDESGHMAAWLADGNRFSAGDRVNLLGFLDPSSADVRLVDAEAVLLGSGHRPDPVKTSAEALLNEGRDTELVSLEGEVVGMRAGAGARARRTVLLQADVEPFAAILPTTSDIEGLDETFKQGALVRVTGVSSIRKLEDLEEKWLEILLGSPTDLELLKPAPRFTSEELTLLAGGLAVLSIAALGWIAFLRQRVAQSQLRFAKAIEASPIPVAIARSGDLGLVEVNDSFLEQFSHGRETAVGRTLDDMNLAPTGDARNRFERELRRGAPVRGLPCELKNKEGVGRQVLISAEPIQFENARRLLLVFQDVTEQLNLMEQLRESQKMEAVGQLAAGIAHDFNNLITVIIGNHDLIRPALPQTEEFTSMSRAVSSAAKRAADLTRQLLTFSRRQAMQREDLVLDDLIRESVEMLKRTLPETIEIELILHSADVVIHCDAGMMNQMIINLSLNARDAMPHGGRICIQTDVVEYGSENLPGHPDASEGRFIRLRFIDTGLGMDDETLPRIFEPFFTTKDVGKGTGLGLSTVFGIVHQHDGWVTAESAPGKGAKFEMFLPVGVGVAETKALQGLASLSL